jgi:hypothetical protein
MKMFLLAIFAAVSAWVGNFFIQSPEPTAIQSAIGNIYSNGEYGYSLKMAPGYQVDNSVPELTLIKKESAWLRVNAGCFDSGIEGLKEVNNVTAIGNIVALRSEYYDDTELMLERIIFDHEGMCFALELSAETNTEWEELRLMAKTFVFHKLTAEE